MRDDTPATGRQAAYAAALAEWTTARQEVEGLINRVANGMTVLRTWRQAQIATPAADHWTIQIPGHSHVLDSQTWPSAADLATALQAYQAATAAVQHAWAALSPAQRAAVDVPDTLDLT